ncbi:WW domain containing protein [Nitzschia inconspicua]|uniref:WW domain containing protein n=1 Tax=Nitzschia inconspicua TaxID=303405 RepID=A0A9K3LTY9_9STRA|nr:WW domain containing protein [Nitzschia inconspicua]
MNGRVDDDTSSFAVFSKVDELVSKPVLGSDGAASWQHFRKEHSSKIPQSQSVAPKAPLKKSDRVVFASWEEERRHEDQVRKVSGHQQVGSGYTAFKKKNDAEEAKERKRKAQIEKRIRPDDKEYFIPSPTFVGWKFDYIFTTRIDRGGTGYYWDGHDSIKSLKGGPTETATTSSTSDNGRYKKATTTEDTGATSSDNKPKKKKRKKEATTAPIFVSDPNNPMEQAQAIWQKRNQALLTTAMAPPTTGSDLPPGWESAHDPSSGKLYYFHRSTGQRSWEKPTPQPTVEEKKNGDSAKDNLPEGWKTAIDTTSGKTYFYHTNGETRWERPEVPECRP